MQNGPASKYKNTLVTEVSMNARQTSDSKAPAPHCTLLTAAMVHSARSSKTRICPTDFAEVGCEESSLGAAAPLLPGMKLKRLKLTKLHQLDGVLLSWQINFHSLSPVESIWPGARNGDFLGVEKTVYET